MPQTIQQSLAGRLFHDHPRSLGMTWLEHGLGAMRIAGTMIAAGMACAVHAIVPGWFTETAGQRAPSWRNEVTLRTIEYGFGYEPGAYIG